MGEVRPNRCRYMRPNVPMSCWQPVTWTAGLSGTVLNAPSMNSSRQRRGRVIRCIDAALFSCSG